MKNINICIIGAGSIGTALGNALVQNRNLKVTLLSIEKDTVKNINTENINKKYFPNILLNKKLKATTEINILNNSEIIFLAIPSSQVIRYLYEIQEEINHEAILVNLAKGFGNEHKTIVESIKEILPNPACSLKGPTFAREIIENAPSSFTFASKDKTLFKIFTDLTAGTNLYLDFSTDVLGVELTSILKNIYAIVIGIIDAKFNSPNLRFFMLTKTFKELRNILKQFNGKDETLFKYCGFGDFTLTALNDLSRNRTLGLFTGKGFYTKEIQDKVLLEGIIATKVFCEEIAKKNNLQDHYIINELYKVFYKEADISEFINRIIASK